jgi:4-hydroxy-4-methyl-2-oxoglutarate aldolase
MKNEQIADAFRELTTPLVTDACVRLGLGLRIAPPGISGVIPGCRAAGRVLPARHYGSVDVFLEAMEKGGRGDILVIDNAGRLDEACIGDLTVLEARASGLAGVVVWGCHRDTAELVGIGFPVFTLGTCPAGPVRLDPRHGAALQSARVGPLEVSGEDIVFSDDDGVLFVAGDRAADALRTAAEIRRIERKQAEEFARGQTLRDQLRFREFIAQRANDPAYTFRKHLRRLGGAIEE